MTAGFSPHDRLGRYELEQWIGGGGFASVWRARSVGPGGFERAVAIKVMRPGRGEKKRMQDMLLDEARLVARIHHPNVAQIWEVGEDPRSVYVVMELVDGDSLDALRDRAESLGTKLPLRAVFRVLSDIAGGLHAAHELAHKGEALGIVHRDISPQNILVARDGTAKLIDFGIAKARERLAADTSTGFIKGKIAFMAPEQARSEAIDRRADVWALGAVAFELIEGRPPFDATTEIGRFGALVGPMPAPTLSLRVPGPLRDVVARTLEKDVEKRYPTARALQQAIDEALIESELETTAHEVGVLFEPFFEARVEDPASRRPAALEGASTIERPVSSTLEAPHRSATIELPLVRARLWPYALGATAVLGLGAFLSLREGGEGLDAAGSLPPETSASAAPSLPSSPPPAPPAPASASAPPAASSAPPARTSVPTRPTSATPSASAVLRPPATASRPTPSDEDAIE